MTEHSQLLLLDTRTHTNSALPWLQPQSNLQGQRTWWSPVLLLTQRSSPGGETKWFTEVAAWQIHALKNEMYDRKWMLATSSGRLFLPYYPGIFSRIWRWRFCRWRWRPSPSPTVGSPPCGRSLHTPSLPERMTDQLWSFYDIALWHVVATACTDLRSALGWVGAVRGHDVGDVFITCRGWFSQGRVENLLKEKMLWWNTDDMLHFLLLYYAPPPLKNALSY